MGGGAGVKGPGVRGRGGMGAWGQSCHAKPNINDAIIMNVWGGGTLGGGGRDVR